MTRKVLLLTPTTDSFQKRAPQEQRECSGRQVVLDTSWKNSAHCAVTDVHNTEFPLTKLKDPLSTSLALLQGIWTGERTSLKLHLEWFHDDTGRQGRGRYTADQHWKLPSEICLIILLPGVLHTSGRAREALGSEAGEGTGKLSAETVGENLRISSGKQLSSCLKAVATQ